MNLSRRKKATLCQRSSQSVSKWLRKRCIKRQTNIHIRIYISRDNHILSYYRNISTIAIVMSIPKCNNCWDAVVNIIEALTNFIDKIYEVIPIKNTHYNWFKERTKQKGRAGNNNTATRHDITVCQNFMCKVRLLNSPFVFNEYQQLTTF